MLNFHEPPSCCRNEPTPFMVCDDRALELRLTQCLGSSLIANSAYPKWPSRRDVSCPRGSPSVTNGTYPVEVPENTVLNNMSSTRLSSGHSLYLVHLLSFSYPEANVAETPVTGSFDLYFVPKRSSPREKLARQYRYEPPTVFVCPFTLGFERSAPANWDLTAFSSCSKQSQDHARSIAAPTFPWRIHFQCG